MKEVLTVLHELSEGQNLLKEGQNEIMRQIGIKNGPTEISIDEKIKLRCFPLSSMGEFERVNAELKECSSFTSVFVSIYFKYFLCFVI